MISPYNGHEIAGGCSEHNKHQIKCFLLFLSSLNLKIWVVWLQIQINVWVCSLRTSTLVLTHDFMTFI